MSAPDNRSLIARDARQDFTEKLTALGVADLDWLQEKRRELYDRYGYAYLKAMYGPFGRYDETRRALRSALQLRFFSPIAGDPPVPEKQTEKVVEAWAEAHPEYGELLNRAATETKQYIMTSLEVQEIEEQIASRERELGLVTAELRGR